MQIYKVEVYCDELANPFELSGYVEAGSPEEALAIWKVGFDVELAEMEREWEGTEPEVLLLGPPTGKPGRLYFHEVNDHG
jgi:hypothetical protein